MEIIFDSIHTSVIFHHRIVGHWTENSAGWWLKNEKVIFYHEDEVAWTNQVVGLNGMIERFNNSLDIGHLSLHLRCDATGA